VAPCSKARSASPLSIDDENIRPHLLSEFFDADRNPEVRFPLDRDQRRCG
jgi:hypothetical protein